MNAAASLASVTVLDTFISEQGVVVPEGLAILAPIAGEGPARQGFAGIPLALAVMQQAAGSKLVFQSPNQFARELALLRSDGGEVPFLAVHTVDRNKRGLAAHREAHVMGLEFGVDPMTERFDLLPLLLGVRLRDARRLEHSRDPHLVNELRFARVHRPANRRGTGRLGRAGERDVTFAREQTGSRVEADPTGAGQKDFAPGVEVGEIDFRAGGAVQRLHVRL